MSIKDKFNNNKNKILFWFIVISISVFSFSAGYLLAFETNPAPVIIEKCSRF